MSLMYVSMGIRCLNNKVDHLKAEGEDTTEAQKSLYNLKALRDRMMKQAYDEPHTEVCIQNPPYASNRDLSDFISRQHVLARRKVDKTPFYAKKTIKHFNKKR